MSCNEIVIKHYDTPDLDCEYVDDNTNEPVSLVNLTIEADMSSTNFPENIQMSVKDLDVDNATFILSPNLDYLPVGYYKVDILFTNTLTGRRVASDTFTLRVVTAITKVRV